MKRAALTLASTLVLFMPTSAHSERFQRTSYDNDGRTVETSQRAAQVGRARTVHQERRSSGRRHSDRSVRAQGTVIGGRPAGCPKAFCGCAASIKLFGKIRPELNLALNWVRKFPRTAPAPMMAAARSGHVMVLLAHVRGDVWQVYDGNTGGARHGRGLTLIHNRSIRGFAIVNPHGTFARLE